MSKIILFACLGVISSAGFAMPYEDQPVVIKDYSPKPRTRYAEDEPMPVRNNALEKALEQPITSSRSNDSTPKRTTGVRKDPQKMFSDFLNSCFNPTKNTDRAYVLFSEEDDKDNVVKRLAFDKIQENGGSFFEYLRACKNVNIIEDPALPHGLFEEYEAKIHQPRAEKVEVRRPEEIKQASKQYSEEVENSERKPSVYPKKEKKIFKSTPNYKLITSQTDTGRASKISSNKPQCPQKKKLINHPLPNLKQESRVGSFRKKPGTKK